MLRLANSLGWRPGASKVLVMVGDDLPHEANFAGNKDKVDWQKELKALASRDVAVYSVSCQSIITSEKLHERICIRRCNALA